MFGRDQPVELRLLEIPFAEKFLKGFMMEMYDSAYPLVTKWVPTVDPSVAFDSVDYCVFVGAFPRKDGMTRADLLKRNGGIFKTQGEYLEKHAKKTCKSLVVGNPANTNCLVLSHYAPKIPKENFTAMTRLDLNRAKAQIAIKVGCGPSNVINNISWGNHSATQIPDVNHGYVEKEGEKRSIREAVGDDKWLDEEFSTCVKKRGSAVIAARGKSSASSAARAACDHFRSWVLGTDGDKHVSMGVYSTGDLYGIPKGIIYSFPVLCKGGKWAVVKDLKIDEKTMKGLKESAEELLDEKEKAFSMLGK